MTALPDTAAARLASLLDYIEELVRLDENVAKRLGEHRLPNGRSFVLHQHELHALPGITLNLIDDDGPIWLAAERLRRSAPPAPPEEAKEWIDVSPDPDALPVIRSFLLRTVTEKERGALVSAGQARAEDCAVSMQKVKDDIPLWDVRLRIEDRPEISRLATEWLENLWTPWAIAERPVRRSLALYQQLFEIVQLTEMGANDHPFEIVWGVGLTRWKRDGHEVDLPLIERLVEIEIDEKAAGTIKIRPRTEIKIGSQTGSQAADAGVNLRPFDAMGIPGVSLARDAARRLIATMDQDEGISPFQCDSFEPTLRACQTQLDAEGVYLPDTLILAPEQPVPPADSRLTVSDRWVIFARRRSDSFLLNDLNNLKQSIELRTDTNPLPGPARTLVMGPQDGPTTDIWKPLSHNVGESPASETVSSPTIEAGDLFFPKPFNDEQVEIIRRLKASDGVVVQGPPGTGKTHTISNIICHAMALGHRVLVVSHGEPALAVLRDQLPEGIRDLAISVTATEREGLKQLETAVRLLQSVVEDIRPDEQNKLIRDLEAHVLGLREKLAATDKKIAQIATTQLLPAFGHQPAELARKVVAASTSFHWFEDRPAGTSIDLAPSDAAIDRLRAARAVLGPRLQHLSCTLPSVEDLPSGEAMAKLHEDLVRSKTFAEAAARDPSIRIRLTSPSDIALAMKAAEALATLRRIQPIAAAISWLEALADRSLRGDESDSLLALIKAFVEDARPVVHQRQRYIALPVELPAGFDQSAGDASALVTKLAAGEQVFGLFSFRAKSFKPLIEGIRVRGLAPANANEWQHVRDHLVWRDQVTALSVRWRALGEEIGAPPVGSARDLEDLVGNLDAILIEARKAFDIMGSAFAVIMADGASPQTLWPSVERMTAVEDALRNAAAATHLAKAQAELTKLTALFPDASGKLGKLARDILNDAIGLERIEPDHISRLWSTLRNQIADVKQHATQMQIVRDVSAAIEAAGASRWAKRLRTEPLVDATDTLLPGDWRDAWDWAAAKAYLMHIDDRGGLQTLSEERVRLDSDLRNTFERLVKARTFYELGRSMKGTVRSALMMFTTALRKIGKGTGKGAARHRRDARLAMAQCYSAIPCWIMPTWRVAEQLPGEIGSFDLVIMDEASQSDIKELPALLRGKKILVVGDDKQVSPSAAFIENAKLDRLEHNFLQKQPFKTLLLPGSSLYDLAKVMFPDKLVMLREHFRCAEPIIRFSMGFYPEPLVPLRVPNAHERLDPPLVDIYVPDGRRVGDKQNPREAEVIVEEIRTIINEPALARIEAHNRWRTIGVVSLIGAKQAALINRLLLEELGEEIMRRHHIACGDSATFQGNERDVIFLSMIADPNNKQAQTATQFEQRFNVAMSRARDRLVLVRSVHEEELKHEDLKARIIRHFRDPMAEASAPKGDLAALCESEFERDMFQRLTERGYRVLPQVGALGYRIDLVVEGANGQRLAIECDGDKYHGPERWSDDMRRQRILERVGWRFWRCWASSFVLNPDSCMMDLVETLDRLNIRPTDEERPIGNFTLHLTATPKQRSGGKTALSSTPKAHTEHEDASEGKPPSPEGIRIGDRVIIQYLDDHKTMSFTITKDKEDYANGFLSVGSPLGSQLLGAVEDEEIAFEESGRARPVLIVQHKRAA